MRATEGAPLARMPRRPSPRRARAGFALARSSALLGSLAGAAFACATRAQEALFPFDLRAVGVNVQALAVGDVDRDGQLDLVSAQRGSVFVSGQQHSVALLLGRTDGSFALPAHTDTEEGPAALVLADLDGDGWLDAATANHGNKFSGDGDTLSLLFNDGRGAFLPARSTPACAVPSGLIAADFDGDGSPDLATCEQGTPFVPGAHVGVLLNLGAGDFAAAQLSPAGTRPRALVAGHFDADSPLDLAVGCSEGVALLAGDGAGGFAAPQFVPLSGGVEQLAAADLNGDGELDLVASTPLGLVRLLGDGVGGIANVQLAIAGASSRALALGELNGDGKADLAFSSGFGGALELHAGDGAGGFTRLVTASAGAAVAALALVPQTFPTAPHVALALNAPNAALGGIALWRATTPLDGGLAPGEGYPARLDLALGGPPRSPLALDFDGDGTLDLGALLAQGELRVAFGDGTGAFGLDAPLPFGATEPHSLGGADFDRDGDLDLVASHPGGLTRFDNLGAGAFALGQTHLLPAGAQPLLIEDWNADGLPDLAVGSGNSLELLFGGASGDWTAGPVFPVPGQLLALARGEAVLGGAPALVAATSLAIANFPNDGLGQLGAPVLTPVPHAPSSFALGDLDGDGRLDAASCALTHSGVLVRFGDGQGGFGAAVQLATGEGTFGVALADVDSDGRLDVLAVDAYSHSASLRRTRGGGSFAPLEAHALAASPTELVSADLDADGRNDLIAAQSGASSLGILRQRLPPVLGTSTSGTGTPGCLGRLGLRASQAPFVGNQSFGLAATNAPRIAPGFVLLSSAPRTPPSIVLGLTLHVDPSAADLALLPLLSDTAGGAYLPLAIPQARGLAGLTLRAQAVFLESAAFGCSAAQVPLDSSRALALELQR